LLTDVLPSTQILFDTIRIVVRFAENVDGCKRSQDNTEMAVSTSLPYCGYGYFVIREMKINDFYNTGK